MSNPGCDRGCCIRFYDDRPDIYIGECIFKRAFEKQVKDGICEPCGNVRCYEGLTECYNKGYLESKKQYMRNGDKAAMITSLLIVIFVIMQVVELYNSN